MIRSFTFAASLLILTRCASVGPTDAPMLLFLNHDSGGSWPRVTETRIYTDGTVEFTDATGMERRRVRADDALFRQLTGLVDGTSFRDELQAAAVPSKQWQSSGEWLRIQHGQTTGFVKPPEVTPAVRKVMTTVGTLLNRLFGGRYRPPLSGRDPGEVPAALQDDRAVSPSIIVRIDERHGSARTQPGRSWQ